MLTQDSLRLMRRRAWLPTRLDDGWTWGQMYLALERLEPDEGGWTAGAWRVVERWRHGVTTVNVSR